MSVLHVLTFALLAAAPAPVPKAADLARAQADVQEVFGGDLQAARKPADRVALARRMIDTADGSNPAARYALLTQARELAIAARDSAVGIRTVEALVTGFAPVEPQDAAQWAADGHRLWNQAGGKRSPEGLRGRLAAAECYLRAMPRLVGFQKGVVEKRLRELGWRVGPIDFNFDESTEGWTIKNHIADLAVKHGCLTGRITSGDPYLVRKALEIEGSECPVVEIRMAVTGTNRAQVFWTTRQVPRWVEDQFLWFSVVGDGEMRTYRINVKTRNSWTGQIITSLRIDPGEWDHHSRQAEAFSIDYIRGGNR